MTVHVCLHQDFASPQAHAHTAALADEGIEERGVKFPAQNHTGVHLTVKSTLFLSSHLVEGRSVGLWEGARGRERRVSGMLSADLTKGTTDCLELRLRGKEIGESQGEKAVPSGEASRRR